MAERRIVIFESMTADGYFAGADGNLDWVVPADEQARAAANEIARFDTVLFGRRTYEQFAEFWPRVLAETIPTPCRILIIPDDGLASTARLLSRWTR